MDDQTRELMFSSANPNYGTPDELFQEYKEKYNIEIDVCATKENTKCKEFISPEMNMLFTDWYKTGWMNPPYNKPEKACKKGCTKKTCKKRGWHNEFDVPGQIDFVARVVDMCTAGTTTICLLPARTDSKLFHKYIWDKNLNRPREGVELSFLEGRVVFNGEVNAAPFPSMIVVFHGK